MVICRKVGTRNTPGRPDSRSGGDGHAGTYGQNGPVFVPPRKSSPFARTLLARSAEGQSVTTYDELWYLGRPRAF